MKVGEYEIAWDGYSWRLRAPKPKKKDSKRQSWNVTYWGTLRQVAAKMVDLEAAEVFDASDTLADLERRLAERLEATLESR